MKVSVWCRDDRARGVKGFEAWSGEMAQVPTTNDYICIHDGWALAEVRRVHFNLYDGTAEIEIDPDYTGEYAAAVKERV